MRSLIMVCFVLLLVGWTHRPFPKPISGRIAIKVINHLGDEVMKVFRVN